MESSRKRRTGFIRGKLLKSLYRAAAAAPVLKPTASTTTNYSSEDSPHRTVYHLNLHHHHQPKEKLVPYNPNSIITVNQEKAAEPLKPKVSYYIPPQSNGTNSTGTSYNYTKMDKSNGDESVDMKAAKYISYVRERFRSLERSK
ncbi:hypothetical protein HAX54_036087 [Datura stramonium]|uniref:Uncharacterized protein n=1 Tax=Datura stramonium TaxID=4076 RepID=A0ABS8VIZ8_DATST|nr:hypothetical protein [Datura stramonium]